MPRKSFTARLAAAALSSAALGCAQAQVFSTGTAFDPLVRVPSAEGISLQPLTRLETPEKTRTDRSVSFASAEEMEGSPETEMVLRGDAEIRQVGTVIRGDSITYTQETGVVKATGNAAVHRGGASFYSDEFRYQLDEKSGDADEVEFEYAPRRLRGSALCMRFRDTDVTEFDESRVTTCRKGDDSWWVEFESLTLDDYEQEGWGRWAKLRLGGYPVFASPWFTFPMAGQRKTGLLTPSMGYSSSRGVDITVPYYFNIAPNYDYTVTPRLMSRRGLLLGNQARWLTPYFNAEFTYDWLPDDRVEKRSRYSSELILNGRWNGFTYGIYRQEVSDDDYTDDFSPDLRGSEDETLPQNYWISYAREYWNTSLRVNKNQTLNINGVIYDKPYEKVPEFSGNIYFNDLAGFELHTSVTATRFKHPTKVNGDRFVFDQSVAYPLMGPGWHLTPRVEYIGTSYDLESPYTRGADTKPSISVPIYSLDGGLVFERNSEFNGRETTQTLEPRLYFAYIPYRDQSAIPAFDSSLMDLTFGTLFLPNQWSGYDRIPEKKQVTGAITTRLIDDATGAEMFRFAVGQQYNFNDWTVNSSGKRVKLNDNRGDFLASVGARLTRTIQADAHMQYSYEQDRLKRVNAGVRWQPRPLSVIGLYYRYNWEEDLDDDDRIKQVDLQVQWPINRNLYFIGRSDYSFYDRKFIENILGFEYHADCWTLRALYQRYTKTDESPENTFYFQLELNGLGSIGTNPIAELARGIRGYQTVPPAPSTIGTYDYYQ